MPCYKPLNLKIKGEYRVINCGRCMGCRLERARQWSARIMNEAQMHDRNHFLTLTYDDDHVTHGDKALTLVPKDLEKYWKRLRKEFGNGIRYFACGEYGDTTRRPHYHACVFGHDFEDKKLYSIKGGNRLYSSESANRIWGNGNCIIGELTYESANYVARYICDKKLGQGAKVYEELGIEPEFARMSRKPGIGASWFDKYGSDVFPHDYQIIRGGIKSRPSRYYSDRYSNKYVVSGILIKDKRQKAALENEDNFNLKRLAIKERIKKRQIEGLTKDQI